jgi:hypothetical protein
MASPVLARPDSFDPEAIERQRVLRGAKMALREPVRTIAGIPAPRSPAGPHDYYSEGDYWWPDPAHPRGPYIRRDGYSNPAKFDGHRDALIAFGRFVPALVAGWSIARDPRYSRCAARHLRAWFVDPETRMNPDLSHAQAIIGRDQGRAIGIIDTLQIVEVARAAERLRGAPGYDPATRAGVESWFRLYLGWLTGSKAGQQERDQANNHGTCWLLQVASFAKLLGDRTMLEAMRDRLTRTIIPHQIAPDGSQPLELVRTKPFGYSLFNLDVLAAATQLLSTPERDLWRFETADGRSVAKAVAFMAPFVADKSLWPFRHDVEYWADWPVRQPSLLFAGLALDRPEWLALWRRLDPDPVVPEILRNFPLRQPILWVGR